MEFLYSPINTNMPCEKIVFKAFEAGLSLTQDNWEAEDWAKWDAFKESNPFPKTDFVKCHKCNEMTLDHPDIGICQHCLAAL